MVLRTVGYKPSGEYAYRARVNTLSLPFAEANTHREEAIEALVEMSTI